MIIIGLTGSVGMGKSTAAGMLKDMGVPVHCSDEEVHSLLAKGGAGVGPVRALFPESYDKKSDSIDRAALGQIVFKDDEKKKALEDVLHPLVQKAQQKFIREQTKAGAEMVVLDIPLLYETGAESRLDYVLVVSAPSFIQKQRVMAREGMTEERFNAIVGSQMSDVEKRKRADFVIPTGAGKAYTRNELERVINKLKRGPSYKNESNRFPTHDL
jgi:dephospho-CoA kinase